MKLNVNESVFTCSVFDGINTTNHVLELVTNDINMAREYCAKRSKELFQSGVNCCLVLEEMQLNVPSKIVNKEEMNIEGIFEEYYDGRCVCIKT